MGYYAGSRSPDRQRDDRSYRARFDYDADLFGLQVEHLAAERNFRPEIGFMREDFIESLAQIRVSRRPQLDSAVRKYATKRRSTTSRTTNGSSRTGSFERAFMPTCRAGTPGA